MSKYVIGITGHRPDKLGGYADITPVTVALKQRLRREFMMRKPDEVIVGMAQGVDTLAAIEALDLGLSVTAAVPCDNQDSPWPAFARRRYQRLLKRVSKVHVVSPGPYKPIKMHRRNQWIVDHCSELLAVWNGIEEGGTWACIHYAREVAKPVIYINPNDL